ncbi:trypsin-like peptidase domain-containing protein (plasmid) [Streptomyces cellulosae]|uniref:trypsin-like peptidase domain-containing protein n=1 Tax=Streptomyces cellulosae TaxID=1968 RepID=UPI002F913EAA|nr:trypsin-like peptidase domain-containing protein [Streptomyces cellulosae]WSB58280.1 trypsin-like peptidase domain-containing protein [Streptomyces cellulosae]WTB67307.1 trypsin-like peptidase domain-containing protein [Streptomyces cellulosae]WTB73334.1 trypsin-like peptidase domain-containing protein [Streptomyces cellulosae]WTB73680.1 trypsin-like peptidase domain-containing protein [Streptomyces cellulosae]
MDTALIAEVYATTGDSSWNCGSAYGVGPRLLLTAAHVVLVDGAPAQTVQVRLLGADGFIQCTVVWHRYDRNLDVALLRVTDPERSLPQRWKAVRWGRLVTSAINTSVTAAGFPDVQRHPDGVRDTEQLSGRVNPLTGLKAGWYAVGVEDPPTRVRRSSTPWHGMSGAALFADGLLVGVVAGDQGGFSSQRLTAVPVSSLAADPEFRSLLKADTGRNCVVEPAELRRLFPEPHTADSPAALLRADVEAVPFHGRTDLLAALESWCLEPGSLSTRLLVGGGGEGKTRLGVELCHRLRDQDWVTGRLAEDAPTETLKRLEHLSRPLLLVVDYAETRKEQLDQLARHLRYPQQPVRLLLLARSAGDWLTELATSQYLSSLVDVPVEELKPLEITPAGRIDVWQSAVASLADSLSSLPDYKDTPWPAIRDEVASRPNLGADGTDDSSVLALHMNALAALLEAGSPLASRATRTEDVLLLHEQRYWEKTARTRGLTLGSQGRRNAVASASAWSAIDESEGLSVLGRVRGLRDLGEDGSDEVARWISDLYPTSSHFWATLQPDRLGEHLIGTVLKERPQLLHDAANVATGRQINHLLTVLARAEVRQHHVADVLAELIKDHVARFGVVALTVIGETENPGPLVKAIDAVLAEPDVLPLDVLEALLEVIPRFTERLGHQATTIAELIADRCHLAAESGAPADLYRHAKALEALASRLARDDRRAKAVTVMREVVLLYREKLVPTDPQTYEPHLAEALVSLANQYANRVRKQRQSQGDARRAAQAADEAVKYAEHLVASDPEAHTSRLARYLVSHANRLVDMRQYWRAIAQVERAVAIQARLVGADVEAQLAASLVTLSKLRLQAGQPHEALAAVQRAVAIRRQLFEQVTDPASDMALALTRTLGHLATVLDGCGDGEGALRASEQAAQVASELADARPDGNLSVLADRLVDVARHQSALGRENEATASREQATEIWRRLARMNPLRYLPQLERELFFAATASGTRAPSPAALASLEQAVEICRQLFAVDPKYGLRLADSETMLSNWYAETGRADESLNVLRSAMVTRQQLAAGKPASFLDTLAPHLVMVARQEAGLGYVREALQTYQEACATFARTEAASREPELVARAQALESKAKDHVEAGREEEALTAYQQAVTAYGQALTTPPDPELVSQAPKLLKRAHKLAGAGRDEEALLLFVQAADAYGQLAERNVTRYVGRLVSALNGAAKRLGDAEEVLAMLERVTVAYQRAADADPDRYTLLYVRSLVPLAKKLMSVDREGARAVLDKALDVYRTLDHTVPVNQLNYAQALETQSTLLEAMGEGEESLVMLRRAAAIYEVLARSDTEAYLSQYAQVMASLAGQLRTAGSLDEALTCQLGALQSYRRLANINPVKYTASYATAQMLVALWPDERGPEEAVRPTLIESVLVWRRLKAPVSSTQQVQLARFLEHLARQLSEAGRGTLADEVMQRIAPLRAQPVRADPDTL